MPIAISTAWLAITQRRAPAHSARQGSDRGKLWPHDSSVIALTLRVETPCTYISASAATSARCALIALEQLGREPSGSILRYPQLQFADPRDQGPAVIADR